MGLHPSVSLGSWGGTQTLTVLRCRPVHTPNFARRFGYVAGLGNFLVTAIYLPPAATRAAAVAPAFLLRRRGLVGRSGASPTSSILIRPVTNFFRPTLSKSMVVRSVSDSETIPYPYCSCLMHCPSERTCTTASLNTPFASGTCGTLTARERVRPGAPGRTTFVRLEAGDVLRLQALGALADLELNRLPFVQSLVSIHLNCREMDKYILARLALDESIALAGIEPLYCSLFFHFFYYLALSYLRFSYRPAHLAGRGAEVSTASSP